MKGKRIQWLDFAKGFTIFFVVFIHVFSQSANYTTGISHHIINMIIYIVMTFIMSLFFAISGILYKPVANFSDFKILILKKCKSFIIPYFIFTIIILFIQHMNNFMSVVCHNIINILILPSAYLWFLYALFFIFIIKGLMDLCHIDLFTEFLTSIIFLIFSSIFPFQESFSEGIAYLNPQMGAVNPISGICGYFIIFLTGRFIKQFNIINYFKRIKYTYRLFFMWIIITCSQFLIVKYLKLQKILGNANSCNFGDITPKMLSIFAFCSLFIIWNKHSYIFKYFAKYGKDTLIIYLVHYPIIYILVKLIHLTSFNTITIYCLLLGIFIISWFFSTIICYLSERYHTINIIFYPKNIWHS